MVQIPKHAVKLALKPLVICISPIFSLSEDLGQDLDVQYTIGIASGVPTFFISVGDNFKDGALDGTLCFMSYDHQD